MKDHSKKTFNDGSTYATEMPCMCKDMPSGT